MTRRTRHRGARVPGLFGFNAGQPTAHVDEVPDNPRSRPCPACGVAAGHGCVSRTRRRTTLTDYHPARKSPAAQETDR